MPRERDTEPWRPTPVTRMERPRDPATAARRLADAVRAWRLERFVVGTPRPTDYEAAILRALTAYDIADGGEKGTP